MLETGGKRNPLQNFMKNERGILKTLGLNRSVKIYTVF